MLQNMLLTALTPLSFKTEANSWENRPFRTVWPEQTQQKPKEITRTIKKKAKRVRTAFSTEQLRNLERTFSRYKYINSVRRYELAKSLNIEEKCIKIWFQNRRMKEKRESSESSCDTSSESFGNETPPVINSPSRQVKPETSKTEYANQYYHSNNSEFSYQLPTYYEMPQNIYGVQTSNVSAFYNDNNIYPTHYYPIDMNYPCVGGNGLNSGYGNQMNHYWAANHNSYHLDHVIVE